MKCNPHVSHLKIEYSGTGLKIPVTLCWSLVLKTESENRNLRRINAALRTQRDRKRKRETRRNKAGEYGMCRIPYFVLFTKYH
jgi:hypothetical protein